MDQPDVIAALEKVQDAKSFIAFIDALRADWDAALASEKVSPSSPYASMSGWENTTVGTFLEAAAAGATDLRIGQSDGLHAAQSSWRQAAEILLLGKIYE